MHCQRFTPTPPWLPVAARPAGIAFLAFAAAARPTAPGRPCLQFSSSVSISLDIEHLGILDPTLGLDLWQRCGEDTRGGGQKCSRVFRGGFIFREMHCQRFTPTPPWAPVAARAAGIAFLAFAAAARHRRPGRPCLQFASSVDAAVKNVVVFSEAASRVAECTPSASRRRRRGPRSQPGVPESHFWRSSRASPQSPADQMPGRTGPLLVAGS